MESIKYLVIFRDEGVPSNQKGAYTRKEIDIPKSYLDAPLNWVEHNDENVNEGRHIVLCVPADGCPFVAEHIFDFLEKQVAVK